MQYRFDVHEECVRLRLRPGAMIRCVGGRLWITFEARRTGAPSPDLHLAAGQGLRVEVDAAWFVTSLDKGVVGRCVVDLSRERAGWIQLALRRLCAPASFLIQDATASTSSRGCSSAWISQYRFGLGTVVCAGNRAS